MRAGRLGLCFSLLLAFGSPCLAELRVGAAAVDVSPREFPVLVNGGMTSRSATNVVMPVKARAIVVADEREQIALVVVDSCMLPRPLLDDVKALAAQRTGIRPDRMLISATHTHTAPSSLACLGTDADPAYVPLLRNQLVEAIVAAQANLEPAEYGHAVVDAGEFTALRRWIRRPDRIADDPFGNPTVRATMHAGRVWDDVVGESGPKDSDLTILAFRALDGRPLAVLCNFAMHYFSGVEALHPDYFGLFCEGFQSRIVPDPSAAKVPFLVAMSHGCSGDIWRRDYKRPEFPYPGQENAVDYANGLLERVLPAYEAIEYRRDATIAMSEARLPMRYRVPDKQRLEWATRVVEAMGDRLPKTTEEVYAREQIILHERQSTEVVVQGIRIGDFGIATTPTETYAVTALKIKFQSPLARTMVFDLANGGDGYIPPPEQHQLGGYNTWAARSAGLEVNAEPRITETALQLLEEVADAPRTPFVQSRGPLANAVLDAKPRAYWRLDDLAGFRTVDSSGNGVDAIYEPVVTYLLDGPRSDRFCLDGELNRCVHFVGGRLQARLPELSTNYSVSLWFWNGMPVEGRDVTGWLLSRGRDQRLDPHGDHVGLGGLAGHAGKLIFQHGQGESVAGTTDVDRWTWNHLVFVRSGETIRLFLNGELELETRAPADFPADYPHLFLGGRCDNASNWEGRLDEIAVFDRALSAGEVNALNRGE